MKELTGKPKFLPKSCATNSVYIIFGDYVVMYTGVYYKRIDDDITLFVLRDTGLAESYRTWFRFVYDFCPPRTVRHQERLKK